MCLGFNISLSQVQKYIPSASVFPSVSIALRRRTSIVKSTLGANLLVGMACARNECF
jgi:hypothetical protein